MSYLKIEYKALQSELGSGGSRELSHDLFSTGGKRKFAISRFLEHISRSSQYLFMKSSW